MQPKEFSKGIHALRFLAAIVIVLAHGGFAVLRDSRAPEALLNVIQARSLATSLFFLLSGFVITQSFYRHEVSRRDFLLRRLARLYPIHLACYLLVLVVAWFTHELPNSNTLILQSAAWATMAQGFFPQCMAHDCSLWALTAFMAGYLVLPGFAQGARSAPRIALRAAALLWLAALLPNLALVWHLGRQFVYTLDPAVPVSAAVGNLINTAHSCVLIRVLEMLMGCMLAVFVKGREQSAGVRLVSSNAAIVAGGAAALLAVEYGCRDGRLLYLLTHGLLSPLLAVLIVGVWHNSGLVERALGWRFLQRGGRAALLIYFLHVPVLELLQFLGASIWGADAAVHSSAIFLLSFATTFTLAFWLQPRYDALSDRLSRWLWSAVPDWSAGKLVHATARGAA